MKKKQEITARQELQESLVAVKEWRNEMTRLRILRLTMNRKTNNVLTANAWVDDETGRSRSDWLITDHCGWKVSEWKW
jgi:hypothetical protein